MHRLNTACIRQGIPVLAIGLAILGTLPGCQQPEVREDLSAYPAGLDAKEAPMLAHLVAQQPARGFRERSQRQLGYLGDRHQRQCTHVVASGDSGRLSGSMAVGYSARSVVVVRGFSSAVYTG